MLLSLRDYLPASRFDGMPWSSAEVDGGPTATGPWTAIQTYDFTPLLDADPSKPASRSFTVEDVGPDVAYLQVVFKDTDGGTDTTDAISVAPQIGTFSSVRDVRLRLGRELTDNEAAQAQYFTVMVTISIYGSLGVPSVWVPPTDALGFLRLMATEVCCRGVNNPKSLISRSETVGAYSYSEMLIPRSDKSVPGMLLTDAETLTLRRVVFGTNTASVTVQSLADYYAENVWPFQIAYGLYYSNSVAPIVWH